MSYQFGVDEGDCAISISRVKRYQKLRRHSREGAMLVRLARKINKGPFNLSLSKGSLDNEWFDRLPMNRILFTGFPPSRE